MNFRTVTNVLRHSATWISIGVLWIVSWLPWKIQRALANLFGVFAFHCVRIRRHVTLVNIRICFPELSEKEAVRIGCKHYQSLAFGILEVARCWWRNTTELPPYRIEGIEALQQASSLGKGVILVSGHFTTLEIAGRILALHIPLCCLYRNPNNAVLAKLLLKHRCSWGNRAIEMRDMVGLLRSLRDGNIVWYAPDQGKWTPQSSILPFFGRPAITNTSTTRLAKISGAAVFTFFPRRDIHGKYVLTISPQLDNFPSDDAESDTCRLNTLLESAIRAAPEQYLWVHRRFKGHNGKPISPY